MKGCLTAVTAPQATMIDTHTHLKQIGRIPCLQDPDLVSRKVLSQGSGIKFETWMRQQVRLPTGLWNDLAGALLVIWVMAPNVMLRLQGERLQEDDTQDCRGRQACCPKGLTPVSVSVPVFGAGHETDFDNQLDGHHCSSS